MKKLLGSALLIAGTLAAAEARDVILYKATSAVLPTPERFVTPTLVEPAILNPPGFRWDPVAGAAEYDLEISRTRQFAAAISFPTLKLNLFTPDRALEPGTWFWRVRAASGAWCEPREFKLTAGMPSIPVPPMPQLLERLQRMGYPRVFLTRENLAEWRAKVRGARREDWQRVVAGLSERARAINTADPPRLTGERGKSAENNKVFLEATGRSERNEELIHSLALSCLLGGNAEHCKEARRIVLALAAWDPDAATSRKANDTAFRAVVRGLSRGYDWLNGAGVLSDDDRRRIERVMVARGAQYVEWYRLAQVNTRWPNTSHANGGIPYFGEMAAIFAGTIPEATEWLRYFAYVATANFPAFGRSDGSWSEGGRYYTASTNRHIYPIWGLAAALGLNFTVHPYYVNTGYFKLYSNPPWDKMLVFGDGHNQAVGGSDARLMGTFGSLHRNPDFAWYARAAARQDDSGERAISAPGFLTYDRALLDQLARKADVGRLPLARVFPDTGLAVLRTNLTSAADDVQFLLKSNPFGPVSHANADQAGFYLSAYGEPLLIPSGHYQGSHEVLFGSPHHAGWTWQSWAHNVPLVDGKGQASRSPQAAGQVEHFYHSPVADYVRVDATNAYKAPIADEAVRTINKFAPEMVKRIGSAPVTSYRRAVLFLRPATIVMFDDLEASSAVRLDWLLHAWNRFDIDETGRAATAKNGAARASVRLLTGDVTGISQTGDYLIPVPKDFKTQWHLTARLSPAQHHRVVSVIQAHREGGEVPASESARGEGWSGASLRWKDGRKAVVAFAERAGARLEAGGAVAEGRVLAASAGWFYAADATRLETPYGKWEFSSPVDVLATADMLKVAGAAGVKELRLKK